MKDQLDADFLFKNKRGNTCVTDNVKAIYPAMDKEVIHANVAPNL